MSSCTPYAVKRQLSELDSISNVNPVEAVRITDSIYIPTGYKLNVKTVSDVNYHDLIALFGNTFRPHKNIRLNAQIYFRTSKLTNGIHEHLSCLNTFFSAQFYLKNFSIYSYIRSREKWMLGSGNHFTNPFSYRIEVLYGGNNLKVSLAAQNLFHKVNREESLNMRYYSYNRISSNDNISNVVTLNVSYSFDFGLKVQKETPNVNTTINDSLLK